MSAPGLSPVLTIAQLAKRASETDRTTWTTRRMRRYLVAEDKRRGGGLLINVGTKGRARWVVAIAALPEAWRLSDTEAHLADHEERIAMLEQVQRLHTEALAGRIARRG